MSNLEYEYLDTVKKLDKIFQNNDQEKTEEKNLKERKTIEFTREDELYQEIYSKYNGNYEELVEELTQTIIKNEKTRLRGAYFFGFIFCIISLSIVLFFSNIFTI